MNTEQKIKSKSEKRRTNLQSSNQTTQIGKKPEKTLHARFKELGSRRFKLKNELLAMIPEINRKGIWKKHANSIHEYAARFGDLSATAVSEMIKIEPRLKDKPLLKDAVKEMGVNKAKLVLPMIDKDNEEEVVEAAKDLSVRAIRIWKKEMKGEKTREVQKVELDEEMETMFLRLKKKMGGSNREVMKEILRRMTEMEFPEKGNVTLSKVAKESQAVQAKVVRKELPSKVLQGNARTEEVSIQKPANSRNIPAQIKRQLGHKCQKCNRPAVEYHHQVPFSISKSHESVIVLCKEHHELMHNGIYTPLTETDIKRRRCRAEARH